MLKKLLTTAAVVGMLSLPAVAAELLNVSYDPTRELCIECNKAFAAKYRLAEDHQR